MNKAALIEEVSHKTGLSRKDSERSVNAVFDTIIEKMVSNEKVQIVGFGSFEVKERASHIGRNPRTGEEVIIPPINVPTFKAGKSLKDIISEKKELK